MHGTECFTLVSTLGKMESEGKHGQNFKNDKSNNCIVDGVFCNVNVYNL